MNEGLIPPFLFHPVWNSCNLGRYKFQTNYAFRAIGVCSTGICKTIRYYLGWSPFFFKILFRQRRVVYQLICIAITLVKGIGPRVHLFDFTNFVFLSARYWQMQISFSKDLATPHTKPFFKKIKEREREQVYVLAIDHISQSGGVAPLVMPIFNGVSRFSRGEMIHKKFKKKNKDKRKETRGNQGLCVCIQGHSFSLRTNTQQKGGGGGRRMGRKAWPPVISCLDSQMTAALVFALQMFGSFSSQTSRLLFLWIVFVFFFALVAFAL